MDDDHELVLIAAYRDLEIAQEDFGEVERRTKHGMEMRAAALVSKDAAGEPHVLEAANRHGRLAVGVGVGLCALFGLFAPPLGLARPLPPHSHTPPARHTPPPHHHPPPPPAIPAVTARTHTFPGCPA